MTEGRRARSHAVFVAATSPGRTANVRSWPRARAGAGSARAAAWPADAGPGFEAGGFDDGWNAGRALGRPHGAVAIGDLALNAAGPQVALARVVRGRAPAGSVGKRQELVARAPRSWSRARRSLSCSP